MGVKICSVRCKTGFVLLNVGAEGLVPTMPVEDNGDGWSNSTVSSEQTDAVAKERRKHERVQAFDASKERTGRCGIG